MAADQVAEKKVAFITGVARGQGRAHAVKLASRGMDIIGLDICADIPSMDYPNATEDDLLTTVKLVEAAGGEMVAVKGDVRSYDDLRGPWRSASTGSAGGAGRSKPKSFGIIFFLPSLPELAAARSSAARPARLAPLEEGGDLSLAVHSGLIRGHDLSAVSVHGAWPRDAGCVRRTGRRPAWS
jgi:NAD(P)-dependent dehydrogenase (short-subunit alcohol dehydrogenase family)